MARWGQYGFHDAASPVIEETIFFHDHAMIILAFVLTVVTAACSILLINSYTSRYTREAQVIEIIWTVLPGLILIFLALPSLRLLYILDERYDDSSLILKVTGHQWYWNYEYEQLSNSSPVNFDSYILATDTLTSGQFRLLEVDNRVVIPTDLPIKTLITSEDVIHSWAIPSIGVKVDAIPGRLNQVTFRASYPGVFYGQCSEICGVNHSFIPIVVEALDSVRDFSEWYTKTALTN